MNIDIHQLEFIDQNLREILVEIEDLTGLTFTITSLYRIDDSGVHGTLPLRGADLRMRDWAIGQEIQDSINAMWMYDPDQPEKMCALLHGEGANLHLHVQTHYNTLRI
jgi:hypothetical protein